METKGKRSLALFFILTFLISWGIWLPVVFELNVYHNRDLFIKIGCFIPSLVGIVFTLIIDGKTNLKRVIRKTIRLRFSFLWYMLIFLLLPTITFITSRLLAYFKGLKTSSLLLPILEDKPWLIVPLLLYFIIVQGPLGEEYGWRGYALEKLTISYNKFVSSLLLGIIWALWHLPLFFISGTIQNVLAEFGIFIAFLGYIVTTLLLTFLITTIYFKTGKSLFAVLVFHAISNFSHGLFTVITEPLGALLFLLILFIVTILIVLCNRRLLFSE